MRLQFLPFLLLASGSAFAQPEATILDLKHYSHVFGEERNYRVFLPPDYEKSAPERYPVVYFFHGWSERFNKPPRAGRGYDSGDQYGGDNIARFVGSNKLIVVRWDGYNPRTPGEDYPRPYNISPVETYRQFPLYFPELVAHIDSKFRTIADREHRATAGLSMGGFMSFWVAGKYPHLVGSASNFMGSSEFYVGPNGFPSEYRHTEMYGNYEGLHTRIVTGAKDFIRWYHRRMNAVWFGVRPHHEHEDFDHDHGTPGMARTLAFHMKAFREPLPKPAMWHHSDVYPAFEVWDYSVQTDRRMPGFTTIENVTPTGFRISVREWVPEGRLLPSVSVRVSTGPIYKPGTRYRITDVNLTTAEAKQVETQSDSTGRVNVELDGALHEVGVQEVPAPILAIAGWRLTGAPWASAGKPARLRLTILNKGGAASRRVSGTLARSSFAIPPLAPGRAVETQEITVPLDNTPHEIMRLAARIDGVDYSIRVPLFPYAETADPVVLDGTEALVWQRAIRQEKLKVGAGNGDGKAHPGEQVVLAVRDGPALRLVEVMNSHPCLDTTERVSDAWGAYDNVGATAKYTVVQIASRCAQSGPIPLYVEYQLPNKPEHTLKRAVIQLSISGADKTAPIVKWARLSDWNRLQVRVADGARIASAFATLQSGNDSLHVPLNDEGRAGDKAAGDGIFTGLAPNPRPGTWKVRVEANDEFGNTANQVLTDSIEIR